jgi:hypothetical protein
MALKRFGYFLCAQNGSLRLAEKHQRHSVSGRQANEPILGYGSGECWSAADNLLQAVKRPLLQIHGKSGIRHDVCE